MLFKFLFVFVLSSVGIRSSFGSVAFSGGNGRSFFCATNDNPCLNNGNCVDAKSFPGLGDSYKCECVDGCTGFHCEECQPSGDVCNPNPCRGDCSCNPSCKHELGYYCRSYAGFFGKNCTIPPPVLDCHSDRITVSVPEAFVREYDNRLRNSYLIVQPGLAQMSTCQYRSASNGNYEITIPMPFNTCGTVSQQLSNGNVVFKNQIWFNRNLKNSAFDMPIPAIAFECRYAREYQLMTSIKPTVPLPPTIKEEVSVLPSISLCKSQACPDLCPEHLRVTKGAIYTVGENIHVTMNLDTGNFVTTVAEMSLSCSSSVFDKTNSVEIINAGCGTMSGLPCRVTHNGASHTVCVSFQTPRGLACNSIYIHARLASCTEDSIRNCPGGERYGNRCGSGRRRRSAESFDNVIGPFYIINGSEGVATMRMFPENDLELNEAGMEEANFIPEVIEIVEKPAVQPDVSDVLSNLNEMSDEEADVVAEKTFAVYYAIAAVVGILFVTFFTLLVFMCFRKSKSNVLLNDSIYK